MTENIQAYVAGLLTRLPALSVCAADLYSAYDLLVQSYSNGGKLLVCGNGGSAADAEHIVGELMKGFMLSRKLDAAQREKLAQAAGDDAQYICDSLQGGLPAISLVSHSALSTAFANDVAPDMVFAQQVYGYARPGDAFIGLSTSGNSPNVIYAAKVAKAMGMVTIGFTGESGGALAGVCDVTLKAPSASTPMIQEFHLPLYHTLCMMVETMFFDAES